MGIDGLRVAELRIAQSGLGWKSNDDTVPVTTVPAADIKWIQWIRSVTSLQLLCARPDAADLIHSVARNFQLRLGTSGANGKNRVTFDGFLRDDFERLSNLCKQVRRAAHPNRRRVSLTIAQYYNTTLETKETSVKGWNWGVAEVQCTLSFPSHSS